MRHMCDDYCETVCGPLCEFEGTCGFPCGHRCTPYCEDGAACHVTCIMTDVCDSQCAAAVCRKAQEQTDEDNAARYRWIVYLRHPIGGFSLVRVTSLEAAKDALAEFSRENRLYYDLQTNGEYGARGELYPYTLDDWIEAENMREIGVPFDFPDAWIKQGPRGGVRIEKA